ncbi:DUF2637 domain-containing protein [Streptomyces marokkonensis]|uniref:DUF2637 domain-containing protein n=1 Tax=Streptomyces marokkonensis TaxID=324855 RepID=UPI0011F336A5|nr:DUF2637 domain-containing protein [Streptomyces marokkonensis]
MRAQLARVDAVIVQAVIAGALSFSHLHDVAAAAGQDGWKAWAYPVSVDLLLVAAWRRMRQSQRAGQAAGGPRLWFLVALAASLGANVATAGLLDLDDVPAWLRVMVAGWPAVAFFGGTLLAHAPHTAEEPAASPATDAATAPDGSSSDVEGPDHKVPYSADPEPAPEPSAAPATASAPAPASAPAVALPPALVDRVRALAEEHRSATGRPADPDAVRTRLGLPPSMTASVAAHL